MRWSIINWIELIAMLAIFMLCDKPGIIKYAVVMAISFTFMFFGRKRKWRATDVLCIALPMITYLGLGTLSSLLNASIYTETLKNIIFWTIPFVIAFSLYIYYGLDMSRIVDMQFYASVLAYLIINARFLRYYFHVESMFAYVYGLFLVYYVSKRRWSFCIIAALFLFMADKRIVILAVALTVCIQFFLRLFRNDKRLILGIWGLVTFASNFYLWLIYSGVLEDFCRGIGINTNGRVKMFGQVAEWFSGKFLAGGNGLGIVELILSAWNVEKFSNLHNDLLKFHIELGFIGLLLYFISFAVVFYLIGKKYGTKAMTLFASISIYMIILFSTDNVSIYIIFLLPLYSIYFATISEPYKEKEYS